MYRSLSYGGFYPRGYLAAGLGYPYQGGLAGGGWGWGYPGYGCYGGYGGLGYYGGYGGYRGGYGYPY